MSLTDKNSFKGVYTFKHIRDGQVIWEETKENLIVDQGINYIMDAALANGSALTSFFIGLYKNNYTPIAGDVMATFPGGGVANESTTDYSEATRPAWTEAGVTAKVITNTASPATFTFTGVSTVIWGAFLSSSSVKGGTSGTLISATKFSASRTLLASDQFQVVYTITGSSS